LPRSVEEWLAHQTQVHPQTIDLGLGRLRQVLERLQWREPRLPIITVGGTNGKGSVVAYCESILVAAGHRVGVFTSPHLRDYRERIRLDGRLVHDAELTGAFERIEAARLGAPRRDAPRLVSSGGAEEISLTFFEYNALAALLVFEAAGLDAWVLEVGMGGRLDAVNVVDPAVAVVVSIALDHQEYLGSTLGAIAREKAGIFRRGVPAVLGSQPIAAELIESASALGARLKQLGVDFTYQRHGSGWSYLGSRWRLADLPPPPLLGETQFANAATAIAALEELESRLAVPATAVMTGLAATQLVGRFQVVEAGPGQPVWILDVAHNPDAARVLAANLRAIGTPGRTLAVCGILADKDAAGIAANLRDCIDAWWLLSTEGERGSSGPTLALRIGAEVAAPLSIVDSVAEACEAALAAARADDRIVVFGSFHTVGPALDWLDARGMLAPAAARAAARADLP
jgi:dihydrofolate synthase/folylpolyglutamate synthase